MNKREEQLEDREENRQLITIINNNFSAIEDDITYSFEQWKDYEQSGFIHSMPVGRYILLELLATLECKAQERTREKPKTPKSTTRCK